MARRILIHAGLHKTATTTVQKTLAENIRQLQAHVEIHLRRDLNPLSAAALHFADVRNRTAKTALFEAAKIYFATLAPDDPRPIVFSDENLAGHYIGHPLVQRYGAIPEIMEQVLAAWQSVMGPDAEFAVYLSTRRTGWVEACYWERVKRSRVKLSLADFCDKYPDAADHNAVLERLSERIGSGPILSTAMEDMDHPAAALLAALGHPELFAGLTLPRNQNMRLPLEVYEALLTLNRSDMSWRDLARAKKTLLIAKDPDWEGLW